MAPLSPICLFVKTPPQINVEGDLQVNKPYNLVQVTFKPCLSVIINKSIVDETYQD
jgi:hypothetical protein